MGLDLNFRKIDLAAQRSIVRSGKEEDAGKLGRNSGYPGGDQEPGTGKRKGGSSVR